MPGELGYAVRDQLLSLPSTCREVYHETHRLPLALNAINISPNHLSAFVETVPERIRASVQELQMYVGFHPSKSSFRKQKDSFVALKHLPALKRITLSKY
jgi:hypothetical protein